MLLIRKIEAFGIRNCIICGSFFVQESQCCNFCEQKISQHIQEKQNQSLVNQLRVLSLFEWNPKESDTLSKYILSLKDGQNSKAWSWISMQFAVHRLSNQHSFKNTILIPAAPKKSTPKDHAFMFASALAKNGFGELALAFEPHVSNNKTKQRLQSKSSRQNKINRKLNVNISNEYLKDKKVVLVDDVVTTGATATQAYESLDKPESFAVWALATRGVSCGQTKPLL